MPARPISFPSRFEVVRRIGEGGMGVVYEANDLERGVRVALKTVLHRDADALARFKHEFRALQDIHHPNLVELGELVGDADEVFFTMELVEGTDLLRWIRGERPETKRADPLDVPTAVDHRVLEPDTAIDLVPIADMTPQPDHTPISLPSLTALHPGGFDEARLRESFRQIALGLNALHEAKRIHRDIKPSNVRVTPEGRVVLLDFGLVLESGGPHRSTETVVGTPSYMAPEQASSSPVGAPADWYAVGAMLYQCITGRLPFEGSTLAVLMAKQSQEPAPPNRLVSELASDLDALCVDLLKFDPAARPTGRDVLRRLNVRSADASGPVSISQVGSAPFVGRLRELGELERGYAQAATEAVTVAVYGESGVGKSHLVRRFLEKYIGAMVPTEKGPGWADDGTLVLAGRCYEREAVPYKAFDEIIDTLSRRLARLDKDEALTFLPANVEPMAQLFPALCRVPGISQGLAPLAADPHDRRRQAFGAVRELFGRIAKTRRLVIAIDDLQWTDADSLSLLQELLRPPDAPRILLLVTLRATATPSGENPVARVGGGAAGKAAPTSKSDPEPPVLLASLPGDVRSVHVGRLASADARQLAVSLLKRASPGLVAGANAIANEAGGHPLFIDELVRHAALATGDTAPRLDEALWARTLRLEPPERRVLELTCVIGAPMAQELVAQASGLESRDFARAVSILRTSNLARTSGARLTDAIEPYHDRVREAVVARLTNDERRERHQRIASALEASKAHDPEVLAVHWAGAGQNAKASRYTVVAAEQAVLALAFERAARLYQRAIDLVPEGAQVDTLSSADHGVRVRTLRKRLGDALANTGKGVLAAAEYERAAKGAGSVEALDLRRRAAEQLLRSGRIEEGLAATRAVLAAVSLSLPRTLLGAIVTLLFYRFLLTVRGTSFTSRDESDIAPSELTRVDVCWSVSFTLAYADALRGATFQTLHVILALRAGEPQRVARALAMESTYIASLSVSGWARSSRAIARAMDVAERTGLPYPRAMATACSGIAHCMNLRFPQAIHLLESAIETFRERCPGTAWETTTTQFFLFVALHYACRFKELRAQHERALKSAIERGDHYAAVMLRVGVLNRIWWFSGDSVRARRELVVARETWPATAYHIVHFHLAVAEAYVEVFDGHAQRAYDRVKAELPALRRSLLLNVEALRLEWLGLTLRVSTAAAAAAEDPAKRDAYLRESEASLRKYGASVDHAVNRPMLLAARASIAATRGQVSEARAIVERMATAEDSEEGWLARECARWVVGRMRGGIEGEAQVRAAEASLVERGVVADRRLTLFLFPGLAPHV